MTDEPRSPETRRRLRVSETAEVGRAFVVHGGLNLFQKNGLWPAFSNLVARASRTRGFGDWWGHIPVAEGRCDAMLEGEVALHDIAALKPIVEAAGASCSPEAAARSSPAGATRRCRRTGTWPSRCGG
jgi:histidinol-phosphatase